MKVLQELIQRIQDYEQWIHSLDTRFENSNMVKKDIIKWLHQLDEAEILWKEKVKEWKEKEAQQQQITVPKKPETPSSTNLDKILLMARKIRNQEPKPSIETNEQNASSQNPSPSITKPIFNEQSQKHIFLQALVSLQKKQDEYFSTEKTLQETCSQFLEECATYKTQHFSSHYESLFLLSILQSMTALQKLLQQHKDTLSYNNYLEVANEFETISSYLLFLEDASEKHEQEFLQQINVTSTTSTKTFPHYHPREAWITHKKLMPQIKEELKEWFNPKGISRKGKHIVQYRTWDELKELYCLKFEIQSNLLKENIEKQIIENVLPKLQEMKQDEKGFLTLWKLLHSSLLREGKNVCSFLNKHKI